MILLSSVSSATWPYSSKALICIFHSCLGCFLEFNRASLVEQLVKNPPAMQETPVWFLCPKKFPGKGIDYPLQYSWASLVVQTVKNPHAMREAWVPSLGCEDLLEEGMATHSSILAWRIPGTEEPGGLQSMGCKELNTTEWLNTAQQSFIKLTVITVNLLTSFIWSVFASSIFIIFLKM